ncbi:MAG: hypothetical protein FWD49_07040 [Firmicutes bacterium]|nr:hypothetical protein [Bacillota bacterium]
MKTEIYSRERVENLIESGFPKNAVAISFRDRPMIANDPYCTPVRYPQGVAVYHCVADDITHDDITSGHPKAREITAESFFQDAVKMADFILEQAEKGITNFICQCEFGQSRSAGVAGAIEEFFNKNGISVFADYRYCPNQIIYNKLIKALVTQNLMRKIT